MASRPAATWERNRTKGREYFATDGHRRRSADKCMLRTISVSSAESEYERPGGSLVRSTERALREHCLANSTGQASEIHVAYLRPSPRSSDGSSFTRDTPTCSKKRHVDVEKIRDYIGMTSLQRQSAVDSFSLSKGHWVSRGGVPLFLLE
jgi:hypothetical protein